MENYNSEIDYFREEYIKARKEHEEAEDVLQDYLSQYFEESKNGVIIKFSEKQKPENQQKIFELKNDEEKKYQKRVETRAKWLSFFEKENK